MRNNITKEMAHREMDARRELLEKRQQIMESVFQQAGEKLKEFAASPDYPAWMERHCKEIAKTFVKPGTVLYLRSEDLSMKDALQKAFGAVVNSGRTKASVWAASGHRTWKWAWWQTTRWTPCWKTSGNGLKKIRACGSSNAAGRHQSRGGSSRAPTERLGTFKWKRKT